MADQKYIEYLKSPEWQGKRIARLKMDGFQCAICGYKSALQVHHLNYNNIYHEDVANDLITLCKKCHERIEKEKKRPEREQHKVYLAGKISMTDWRDAFIDCRAASCWWEGNGDIIEQFISRRIPIDDSAIMTGPYFISCDHGCYHGDGTHGVQCDWNCAGFSLKRSDVEYISRRQIDAADVVLAYINDPTCYGTLAEIGYARAKNKYIIVVYDSEDLREKIWFVGEMANLVYVTSRDLTERDNGVREGQKKPSALWSDKMVNRLIRR